ncbi:hypothetical protein K504DRAFT_475211 [Pleomassaria siparia CBS 279.74]|uniref:Uncharacterized protein n=1 Tax=Pleomassaria siparia CBS 279.74 TaxID=1314801 RepID=A0A6G1KEQ2_9PLEO|nr:hypothetical protein K504DRAFT_475211 [Pleomassaria siparia CBS 279.74]
MVWLTNSTSTGSSSSSASLFSLDEDDRSSILVYRYRSGSKALEVSSQHQLCQELDEEPEILPYLRVTKKPIPRGNSRLEVHAEDLMNPQDLQKFGEKPTLKASLANVGLPSTAYWKRLLFNSFPELYIVSKAISPSNSANNSPTESQVVTPAHTFPVHTAHALQDPQANS